MAQGKYQARKRRRRLNPRFVILVLILITLIAIIGTLLLRSCEQEEAVPAPQVTTEPSSASTTVPTTLPTTAPTEPPVPPSSDVGAKVAEVAIAQIGKPYSYGGVGPDSFDASGLGVYCYAEAGCGVARTTPYKMAQGTPVPKSALEPGDILIFWSENPGEPEYEGVYIGGGKFVAARHGDKPVSEMDLYTEYFSKRYICARRFYY